MPIKVLVGYNSGIQHLDKIFSILQSTFEIANFYNVEYHVLCWFGNLWSIHRQVNGMSCSSGFSQAVKWRGTRGGATGCYMPVISYAPARDTHPSAAKWRSQGVTWTPTCALCVRHWRPDVWQGQDYCELLIVVYLKRFLLQCKLTELEPNPVIAFCVCSGAVWRDGHRNESFSWCFLAEGR